MSEPKHYPDSNASRECSCGRSVHRHLCRKTAQADDVVTSRRQSKLLIERRLLHSFKPQPENSHGEHAMALLVFSFTSIAVKELLAVGGSNINSPCVPIGVYTRVEEQDLSTCFLWQKRSISAELLSKQQSSKNEREPGRSLRESAFHTIQHDTIPGIRAVGRDRRQWAQLTGVGLRLAGLRSGFEKDEEKLSEQ